MNQLYTNWRSLNSIPWCWILQDNHNYYVNLKNKDYKIPLHLIESKNLNKFWQISDL